MSKKFEDWKKTFSGICRNKTPKEIFEDDNENTESPKRPKADHPLNICVDFDGVIHKYSRGWKDGKIYDDPVPGAISAIAKLQRKGFSVIIFTARTDFLGIGKWLKEWDVNNEIDFDKVIITSVKLPAIAYIDDRAIRFTNWQDMINYF